MTSQHNEQQAIAESVDEEAVAAFLKRDPEFFARHHELLQELHIPHDVSPAVSLIEYQVRVLRDEKQRVRRRLDELLRVARDNDRLAEQLHRLTLELLQGESLDAVLIALHEALQHSFRADQVCITLIGRNLPPVNARLLAPEDPAVTRIGEAFHDNRPQVGRLSNEHLGLAFGENIERIASAAVLPLSDGPARGLVAVASHDPERYRSDYGTVFLHRMADLVARAVRVHL